MRTILFLAVIGALVFSSAAGELKIATVDLQKVLADYYKAQEATKFLKEKQTSFLKELDGLRLEGRKLAKEAEDLQGRSGDSALSVTAREETKKQFELKLTDLRSFEVRYDDFRAQREAELQGYVAQSNKRVLEEILAVTKFVAEKDGFNLVLNLNKTNPVASDVLFAKQVDDLTDKIVASLNATKPRDAE